MASCFDLGVPQIRKRAILLASLDRRAEPPAPTHSKTGAGDLFGGQLPKWVPMAEALGWGLTERPAYTLCGDSGKRGGGHHDGGSRQREEIAKHKAAGKWLDTRRGQTTALRSPGRSYGAPPRRAEAATEPAPTVALGHNASAWCWERPATTVPATFGNAKGGKGMVAPPGHHTTGTYTEEKGAIPVEPWELGVLQGFPADHPWQPPRVSAQIGNAIPPPLALACLRSLLTVSAPH